MSHNNHIIDGFNKDIGLLSPEDAKKYYLSLCKGWTPYNPDPVVIEHEGVSVVRDDRIPGSSHKYQNLPRAHRSAQSRFPARLLTDGRFRSRNIRRYPLKNTESQGLRPCDRT